MGLRQKEWARKTTARLREEMGGKCVNCGAVEDLQFDCKQAMGHEHHRIEYSHRMSFYRRQLALGNLQLLCGKCNGSKAAREEVQVPFDMSERDWEAA